MKKPDDELMIREVIDKEISAGHKLSERDREMVGITVFHLMNRFSHDIDYENYREVEKGTRWQVAKNIYCKYGLLEVLYRPLRQHFCANCGESVWTYEYTSTDIFISWKENAEESVWEQLERDVFEMKLVEQQVHPPTFCEMWERSYQRDFEEAENKPCPACFSLDTDVNYQEKYFHCDDCGFSGDLEADHPYLR